jgi:glycosyltransferase involved in cell wall biosynthesis
LPCVLHLSADFPDLINPAKTPVIGRLIDLVDDRFDHQVLSLNRRNPGLGQLPGLIFKRLVPVDGDSVRAFDRGLCLEYLAPAKGVLHATALDRLAEWAVGHLSEKAARPDLVIGHKLTVEGLVARKVASQLGIPYALTIQGNTDEKILSLRPDLSARFGAAYHDAACVFSFAPWARRAVERRLGRRRGLTLDLPCPTVHDTIQPPVAGGTSIISVFHLRNFRIKNLTALVKAARQIGATGQPCDLRIYGGGSPEDTARCQAIISDAPGVRLMGPRNQEELRAIMNGAVAFVMPSRRESFGLVFIEALFAGLPIIYPKGAGVDGYFDGLPFAIGVNAHSTAEIRDAIRHAIRNENALKEALHEWQQAGGLDGFSRAAIARTFEAGLHAALRPQGLPQQH